MFLLNDIKQTRVYQEEKKEGETQLLLRLLSKRFGVMGIGRVCADFWPVVKDDRGRMIGNLAGYYPEASWGQLNLNNTATYVLGRGKNGAIPTVRSECLREGVQELEARVIKVDKTERRIGLSIKAANYSEEQLRKETEAFDSLRPGEDMVGLEQAFQAAQEEYRPGDSKKR
mgnify:CR=1 FL=1